MCQYAKLGRLRVRMGHCLKLILALALIMLFLTIEPPTACADTNVGGPITDDTTWTLAGSPYIVIGNVLVMEGVTLTIEPGVVVEFDADKALQVDGELIAQGTTDNPITFTSNVGTSPGDWGYVLFSDSSVDATYDAGGNYVSGSIIQYAIIEYGGGASVSNNGALRIDTSSPFIDHNTIRHSASNGIGVDYGAPKLTYNTITDNAGRGISVKGDGSIEISHNVITSNSGGISAAAYGGTVTISDNTITGNTASGHGGGIYADGYGGTVMVSGNTITGNSTSLQGGGMIGLGRFGGTVTISGNTITGNMASSMGGGISFQDYGAISNNIITDNSTSQRGGGIYATYGTVTISGNTIVSNSASRGGGIYRASGGGTISGNTILNNMAGNGRGGVYIDDHPDFNDNNIYGNTDYDLYNGNAQGSADVNAENNWWGTTDSAQIAALIWDWFDDSNLGIVDYNPYRTEHNTAAPISPPTGLTAAISGTTSITMSWSVNPESDLAGYKVYYDADAAGFPYDGTGANEGDSPIDVGNVTSFSLTGLAAGTYFASVTAYDTAADGENDQADGNESWFAKDIRVPVEPALSISKTDSPDPVATGDLLTYTIVVHNAADTATTDATITDTIPTHTAFVAASAGGLPAGSQSVPGGTSPPGNYIQWSGHTIPTGDSLTVTLVVRVDSLLSAGTVITNAGYGATCAEGDVASGSPITTTVQSVPVLRISKADRPDPVVAGDLLTYTIVVQNAGEAIATGVTITDTVPASTVFVSAGAGGALVGDQVQWTGQTVGASGSLTVTFTVQVTGAPDGPPIVNRDYGVACDETPTPVMGPPVTTWRREPSHPSTPGG